MWRVDSVLPRIPGIAAVVKTENECGGTLQPGTVSREGKHEMDDYV